MQLLKKILKPKWRPSINITVIKPVHSLINVCPVQTLPNKKFTMVHLYYKLITVNTYQTSIQAHHNRVLP